MNNKPEKNSELEKELVNETAEKTEAKAAEQFDQDDVDIIEVEEQPQDKKQRTKKFKKERKNEKKGASVAELKRRLKYGSLSAVLTAIVILAIILVNVLVSVIADKVPQLSLDTTAQQYYELSDESKEYLATLDGYELEIIFMGDRQELRSDEYYSKITTLAEKYSQYTPDLKVSYVDLDKTPGFAAEYDNAELTVGDALVVYKNGENKRYRHLTSADFLYNASESDKTSDSTSETEAEPVYSLNAEYALSTAIMVVTASDNPKATVITGHGEKELPKLVTLLENNGFEVGSQSIVKELDYDSNLLIIAAPTKDYSEDDLKKLDDYMYNKGNYGKNIFYIADYRQPVLPNLEAFLYDWGIVIEDGVVYEGDDSKAYANMPYLNSLTFYDASITLPSALAEVSAYGYYGRPAKIANVLDVNMENSIILTHSETSMVGQATSTGFEKGDGDAFPYVAMACTSLSKYNEKIEIVESNLLFANSTGFFEDELFEKAYSANPDVTAAAINSVLGRENVLFVPTKSLTAASLGITYNKANIIGGCAAIAVPVILLVICLFVYIRRRFL